jgi:hypothetical protein
MVELINSMPDFSGAFGDSRIENRAGRMLSALTRGRNASVYRISGAQAERKAFYRLLENDRFSEAAIEQSIVQRCSVLCEGRHVLCIQDTTEFNLKSHRNRLKQGSGVGKTTKKGF